MAKVITNARAYSDGGVWVTAVGVTNPTFPADPTAPYGVGFTELGWLSDNGLTEAHSVQTTQKFAWQGSALIRTIKSQDLRTFKFQCYEENAPVLGLTRPGSVKTTTTGITTTQVKPFTGQDRRGWGIDFIDGSVHRRVLIGVGEAELTADLVDVATDLKVYEFTVTCYPDTNGNTYVEISDNPALV